MVIKYEAFRRKIGLLRESNMTNRQTSVNNNNNSNNVSAATMTMTITFSNWFWCGWLNWCYDSGWLISISISLNMFVYFKTLYTCTHGMRTRTMYFRARLLYLCCWRCCCAFDVVVVVVAVLCCGFYSFSNDLCECHDEAMNGAAHNDRPHTECKHGQICSQLEKERKIENRRQIMYNWCEAIRKP